jgi:GNAT superfamily N-acetyltransferase
MTEARFAPPSILDEESYRAYEQFVFPSLRGQYRAAQASGRALCIGLEAQGEAAGIAVVDSSGGCGGWIIRYLFVQDRSRRRGAAKALLDSILVRARAGEVRRVEAYCVESGGQESRMKTILAKAGFAETGISRELFRFDLQKSLIPFLREFDGKYGRFLRHRESLRFLSFAELGPREYARLSSLPGDLCPPGFRPLGRRASLEDCARDGTPSLIAFEGDEPLGWIVFADPHESVLYVDSLFVSDARRDGRLFLELLGRSLGNIGQQRRKLVFYVDSDNGAMLGLARIFEAFIEKRERLLGYAIAP